MPRLGGPFGPYSLPDDEPPFRLDADYREHQVLMSWAAALQVAFERQAADRVGFAYEKFIGYGLLNPDVDDRSGLGVLVYCEDGDQASDVVGSVGIDGGYDFPVVVRRVRSELLLGAPGGPSLNGASPTCWARSRRPNVPDGFLTAKHVLGPSPRPGMSVPLSGGGHSRLIDMAPDCIDAALLSHPISVKSAMTTAWYIPLSQAVEVDGHITGITPAVVTVTTNPKGALAPYTGLSPISLRFIVSFAGQKGDSGALVHAPPYGPGEGLGIYLGSWSASGASGTVREGYCQHLEQIRRLMELDLYLI